MLLTVQAFQSRQQNKTTRKNRGRQTIVCRDLQTDTMAIGMGMGTGMGTEIEIGMGTGMGTGMANAWQVESFKCWVCCKLGRAEHVHGLEDRQASRLKF